MKIAVLDNSMINKIAAGEVVERPLSIVKELAENAIDAGASVITAEIKQGGIDYIRISDNGCGIAKDDLKTAFLRHATSKIKTYDDLTNVLTMGFRGEALSSVAAVTQLEMVTKTGSAPAGTKIEIHGGQIISFADTGAVTGTTVITRNLFFNTPARRKFLKKPQTEAALIHEMLGRLALAHPNIAFKFINNGQNIFSATGGDLKTAAYYVYGKEIIRHILEIKQGEGTGDIIINGFICAPAYTRGNRSYGNFFVNGRFIKNAVVQAAVEDAYKNRLGVGKFPVYVIKMTIPPARVDVNVHPAKTEARFDDENAVYTVIYNCVKQTLDGGKGALVRTAAWDGGSADITDIEPPETVGVDIIRPQTTPPATAALKIAEPPRVFTITNQPEHEPEPDPEPLFNNARIIGQLFNTYFIIEQNDKMLMLDQHAAHERVLFEEYKQKFKENAISSQMLLSGDNITLSPVAADTLRDNLPLFKQFGFDLAESKKDTFVLHAMPYIFNEPVPAEVFINIIDAITAAKGDAANIYDLKTETIAMLSCKAAVKAHKSMSINEAKHLLDKLETLENPYTCPHGRPTFIEMSRYEIEKKFGRVM